MSHFETVLDLGVDYNANGGQAWETVVMPYPNARSVRNSDRSNAVGEWQLGNRTVRNDEYEYLQDFLHAMRGQLHTFLYKDWNDFKVEDEQLANVGESTLQLIKTYGLSINPWVRTIKKPKPAAVTLYIEGVAQTEGADYSLDDTTGIITWVTPPDTGETVTWTGEFYVPARFNVDVLEAQFIGLEERDSGDVLAYELGALSVVEEPDA